MKRSFRILAATLAVLILLPLLAACGEKDRVLASVNGVEFRQSDVDASYEAMGNMYKLYGVDMSTYMTDESTIANTKLSLLDEMVDQEVVIQAAIDKGMTPFTDEDRAASDASSAETLQKFTDYFRQMAEEQAAGDTTVDLDATAKNYVNMQLAMYGATIDSFPDVQYRQTRYNAAVSYLTNGVEMTDAELATYYNETLAAQKNMNADELRAAFEAGTLLYMPEGAVYVTHILFKVDDEASSAASEIYATDPAAAIESLSGALATLDSKVSQIYQYIDEGEPVADLVALYTEDTGVLESGGYLVVPGDTSFYAEFTEGALSLENEGDYTREPVATVYGYHIIFRQNDPTFPADWSEMTDASREAALTAKKDAVVDAVREEYRNKLDIQINYGS